MSFSHLTKETASVLLALHESGPEIHREKISSLAGMKPSNVSRALSLLERVGLIQARKGNIIFRRIHGLKELLSMFGKQLVSRAISGSRAQVLRSIRGDSSIEIIQKRSGLSIATLKRTLHWLTYFFPLVYRKKKGVYALNENGKTFYDVLGWIELAAVEKIVESKLGSFYKPILMPAQFLVCGKTSVAPDNEFSPTGLSVFDKFGIQLLSARKYFVYPRKKPVALEEAIVHALCFEHSFSSTMLYCLLVISKNRKKIKRKILLEKAEEYGLKGLVEKLFLFLETEGMKRDGFFPSWEKFEEKRREYGA
ncbi:winged helix-turn-helix domain-containing protein [Candidatus Micrarchaeota archaeon]|nr:winged helix-turn-helix domain-containing protein [Candidatus Micrarchaeota archaeon]